MKKEKKPKSQRNLVLLITLFSLISLTLFTGKFLVGASQGRTGTLNASTNLEQPRILRTGEQSGETTAQIDESVQIEPERVEEPQDIEPVPDPEMTDARLFFFKLDDQAHITMKSVLRPLPEEEYNIERTIQEMLEGPSANELDKDFFSLIPEGSKLNEVKVLSNTVRLDFSEEFCYNSIGFEGFNGQMKQLVYTATEFPGIDQVLFTIDGELREYINGEGIYTGQPLSRNSF